MLKLFVVIIKLTVLFKTRLYKIFKKTTAKYLDSFFCGLEKMIQESNNNQEVIDMVELVYDTVEESGVSDEQMLKLKLRYGHIVG